MSYTVVENIEELYTDKADGTVVVLFTQPATCVPCRQFKPHFERAAGTAVDKKFLYVDLDTVPDAGIDFEIRAVPTVKLYENGTFVRDIKAPQGAAPFLRDLEN